MLEMQEQLPANSSTSVPQNKDYYLFDFKVFFSYK